MGLLPCPQHFLKGSHRIIVGKSLGKRKSRGRGVSFFLHIGSCKWSKYQINSENLPVHSLAGYGFLPSSVKFT